MLASFDMVAYCRLCYYRNDDDELDTELLQKVWMTTLTFKGREDGKLTET